jgi:hypothetical protein
MGVRQFDAVCETTQRQQSRSSSPDRWDSEDPWFAEQHRQARG